MYVVIFMAVVEGKLMRINDHNYLVDKLFRYYISNPNLEPFGIKINWLNVLKKCVIFRQYFLLFI